MKLKLDLHPIFSDSGKIEAALRDIIEEAIEKRATEVEIIPGKGSGALKKSVLRFLDRPDVKSRYHRIEKDGDNWGRLFVHFRHEREEPGAKPRPTLALPMIPVKCVGCGEPMPVPEPDSMTESERHTCSWCGSPHRIDFRRDRWNRVHAHAELDYTDEESV